MFIHRKWDTNLGQADTEPLLCYIKWKEETQSNVGDVNEGLSPKSVGPVMQYGSIGGRSTI